MANEITVSASISVNKNNSVSNKSKSIKVDMSGEAIDHGIVNVDTSKSAITVNTNVGTYGYLFLHNLDDTNYITYSPEGTDLDLKLKAGEIALLRCGSNSLYAMADTANCKLEYFLLED